MLRFIDLEQVDDGRRSSLQVDDDCLVVVGVLPHNYKFRPATPIDRDSLVTFLTSLKY